MEYMLMFYESKADFARRNENPDTSPYWAAWMAYSKAMTEAGASKGTGNALQPPETSTVVRMHNGQRQVQDGPFADAKEQLGGYMIIETASLDKALEWAARCPAAVNGAVEVRPVLDMCGG
ncbi:MAG: YciI family protein [Verrucomicrobia bacterium]|nr:YciI family protein [Verrucomicrobiota bacterium]